MKNMYAALMIGLIFFCTKVFGQPPSNRLLVGTYTAGSSKGIYMYDFDSTTGKAVFVDSVITAAPSYLAVAANQKFLYAVNELGKENGSGSITSFSYNGAGGKLTKINARASGGDHPCYVAIDRTGNWLVAGNYTGGNFSVFAIEASGAISPSSATIEHQGKSIDPERQEKPHVHCTIFSPDNKYLLVADLGTDKIVSYKFDERTGAVKSHATATVTAGAGPRHIIFHPTLNMLYLAEEMSGNIAVFEMNKGILNQKQIISSLPDTFSQKISAADIHISGDGKFLYSSNRGSSNSIAIFSVGRNGLLKAAGHQPAFGITPRNFCIDPSENFLLVANQDSDDIVVFKRDKKTGKLTDTGNRIFVGNPVCLKWIK